MGMAGLVGTAGPGQRVARTAAAVRRIAIVAGHTEAIDRTAALEVSHIVAAVADHIEVDRTRVDHKRVAGADRTKADHTRVEVDRTMAWATAAAVIP